jgi:oligoendopeptidase F
MLSTKRKKKSKNGSSSLPTRSEISRKDKWKTDHIFISDKQWEDSYHRLEKLLSKLDSFHGKLGESAQKLLDCLKLRDQIDELIGKLYLYAGLKNDEDTRNSKYQAYRDKAATLLTRIHEKNSFFQPEIISIPEKKLWSFLNKNPELKIYRHYLDDLIRIKPHVLPKEQEKILAMSGEISEGPYNIFSMFNNADIKFPPIIDEKKQKIEVTKGRFNRLMQSPNRKVRQNAYQALYGTYQNWTNTLAAMLSTSVKKNIFHAKSRSHKNALEAALHSDNIPKSVYENVIESINKNLSPLHKYMKLRKKILGLNELKPWDLFVPLTKKVKFDILYPQSLETIKNALQPLGDEYCIILKNSFNNGWIDVYENQGKRSGAYSWSTHGTHPFVLLNYNNTMDDMFTVAHELGHALHSYFTHQTQPVIYSGYTTFVAEVASTLNEALLIDYLIKNTTDPHKKFYLLNEHVDQIRGTVYIQALYAEFEKLIHEKVEAGEALIASNLNQLIHDLYTHYLGPAFSSDPLYEINWCRIPHFYYNFYVYKYVTGFSTAISISQKILAGNQKARDSYLHFLTRGSSDYSINLLKDAGVDITSSEPIEATTQLMDKLIIEMKKYL